MMKHWLAGAAALSLMTSIALAQGAPTPRHLAVLGRARGFLETVLAAGC